MTIVLQVRPTSNDAKQVCRDMVALAKEVGFPVECRLLSRPVIAKPDADAGLLWQNLQHAVRTKRIGEVST